MLRKHYPGVERMTQTDRAIAKAAPSLLDLADKLARMVVNEDQSIDKAHGVAATAYLKARGIKTSHRNPPAIYAPEGLVLATGARLKSSQHHPATNQRPSMLRAVSSSRRSTPHSARSSS